jgi:hypothetical protein
MKSCNFILLVDDPICNFISYETLMKNKICKEIGFSRNGNEALKLINLLIKISFAIYWTSEKLLGLDLT